MSAEVLGRNFKFRFNDARVFVIPNLEENVVLLGKAALNELGVNPYRVIERNSRPPVIIH